MWFFFCCIESSIFCYRTNNQPTKTRTTTGWQKKNWNTEKRRKIAMQWIKKTIAADKNLIRCVVNRQTPNTTKVVHNYSFIEFQISLLLLFPSSLVAFFENSKDNNCIRLNLNVKQWRLCALVAYIERAHARTPTLLYPIDKYNVHIHTQIAQQQQQQKEQLEKIWITLKFTQINKVYNITNFMSSNFQFWFLLPDSRAKFTYSDFNRISCFICSFFFSINRFYSDHEKKIARE